MRALAEHRALRGGYRSLADFAPGAREDARGRISRRSSHGLCWARRIVPAIWLECAPA
jgi:hypothetical protein